MTLYRETPCEHDGAHDYPSDYDAKWDVWVMCQAEALRLECRQNHCDGNVRTPVIIDYVAANDEADRLLGRLTAHYADVVAIVDAALGWDTP